MKLFEFGKNKIRYMIQRTSRRRSVGICVLPDTSVILRIPRRLAKGEIDRILSKRAPWILERQTYFKDRFPTHDFVDGEMLPYEGRQIRLSICDAGSRRRFSRLEQELLTVCLRTSDSGRAVPGEVLRWYRAEALRKITASIEKFRYPSGLHPKKITIRNQKRLWGSCTNKHHLSFNWRLVLLPPDILDYVVAHELCHMVHLNHSKKFWSELEKLLPDYAGKRTWLKGRSIEFLSFPRASLPID